MSENRQLTLTDKKKLEAELAELVEAKKKVAEDIQTARGFGDLSENAEYDAAKAKETRGSPNDPLGVPRFKLII